MSATVACPGCGFQLQAHAGGVVECPMCGAKCGAPPAPVKPAPVHRPAKKPAEQPQPSIPAEAVVLSHEDAPPPPRRHPAPVRAKAKPHQKATPPVRRPEAMFPDQPPVPRNKWDDPDDDGQPYIVEGKDNIRCPECTRELPAGTVMCTRCGYNLETGAKAKRVYQPISNEWETGMSYRQRWLILWAGQGVILPFCMLAIYMEQSPFVALPPWFMATSLTAFVVGTYDRINLRRDSRGRVELTSTWRFCFVERPSKDIEVRGFEGITTGAFDDVGYADWFVFLSLLLSGILPGILFYLFVICRTSYYVALCKDHGYPDTMLYRGWDKDLMHEIAGTLQDATGLPPPLR